MTTSHGGKHIEPPIETCSITFYGPVNLCAQYATDQFVPKILLKSVCFFSQSSHATLSINCLVLCSSASAHFVCCSCLLLFHNMCSFQNRKLTTHTDQGHLQTQGKPNPNYKINKSFLNVYCS